MFRVCGKQVELAFVYAAHSAVKGYPVAFLQNRAVYVNKLLLQVNFQSGTTHYAALAPAPGNQRCMAGHAAFCCQDGLRGVHAVDVLWRGLVPYEDDLMALLRPSLGVVCGENDLSKGAARACRKALGQLFRFFLMSGVDAGVKQFV